MMLLWFIIGTGVITLSVVAAVIAAYLVVTGWIDRYFGGGDDE